MEKNYHPIEEVVADASKSLDVQKKERLKQIAASLKKTREQLHVRSNIQTKELIDKFNKPLSRVDRELYLRASTDVLQTLIKPKEIAQKRKQNTQEDLALLQLYLYMEGAFSDPKEIDGKWGTRTYHACLKLGLIEHKVSPHSHLSLPPSPEEKQFASTVVQETPFIQGFAGPEIGYKVDGSGNPLTMRRHSMKGSAIGPYGFMGYQASGLGQLYLGHKAYGWTGEYQAKYPTYKDFYTAVATDLTLAAEVCIKYGKGLYKRCKGDIGAMAALNLAGNQGYEAYKKNNLDFKIGDNMSLGTYINKIKRNLPNNYELSA